MRTHSRRPKLRPARAGTVLLAVLAPLCLPAVAAAAAQTPILQPPANGGLAEPTGLVETPDGELWVANDRGVCRIDQDNDRLVVDQWCNGNENAAAGPQQMDFDPRTNDIYVAEGDSEANGVFRMHWVPGDNPASAATEVGYIDDATKIMDTLPGTDRVWGLTLSPTGPSVDDDGDPDTPDPALPVADGGTPTMEVNFTSRASQNVRRIQRPDLIGRAGGPSAPLPRNQAEVAGQALAPGVTSLEWFDGIPEPAGEGPAGELYLAEGTGVSVIEEPHTDADQNLSARAVPAVPSPTDPSNTISLFPGGAPSTLAADEENHRLYAGTANENNIDQVDVLQPALESGLPVDPDPSTETTEPAIMETYSQADVDSRGHNTITALAVDVAGFGDPGGQGRVFVGEDPELGEGFFGKVTALAYTALARPTTTVTGAPAPWTSETSATFDFQSSNSEATFQCRFGRYQALPAWSPCGGAGTGSETWGAAPNGLSDGVYVFEARAVEIRDGSPVTGEPVRRTIVVDTTAPDQPEMTGSVPSGVIDEEANGEGATVDLTFSGESTFRCSLDEPDVAQAEPCDSPKSYTGVEAGGWNDELERPLTPRDHVFRVWATDPAGNVSAPTEVPFSVRSVAPPDGDGDGVYDQLDQCPNQGGTVDDQGCPVDTDGDGVPDDSDNCDNQVGPDPSGCPPPPPTADLAITRYDYAAFMEGVDPAPVVEDGRLTITTAIRNTGPDSATGVLFRQRLDGVGVRVHRAEVVGADGLCRVPSATTPPQAAVVHCALGQLPERGTAEVQVSVTPLGPGTLNAGADILGAREDPDLSDNSSTLDVGVAPRPTCAGQRADIVGTGVRDVIAGTPGADVIVAQAGNDTVDGEGGNDLICGSGGDDFLRGQGGKDRLNGQSGSDICDGGPGRDRVRSC